MRLLIFILLFNFSAFADNKNYIVQDIYVISEDYNARLAKEKAFKMALDKSYQNIASEFELNIKSNKWKIIDSVESYQIKNEKISDNKYSAFFDIKFNIAKLQKLSDVSQTEAGNKVRLIFDSIEGEDIFVDVAKNLSKLVGAEFYNYNDVEKLYSNDIIMTCINSPNDTEYVLSVEKNGRVINFTAQNIADSYFSLISTISAELNSENQQDVNYVLMDTVQNKSDKITIVEDTLKKYFELKNITVAGYDDNKSPLLIISLVEKDDLFLSYVYNSNDYKLSDMRIFKQVFEKL